MRLPQTAKNNRRGFTLVELLVVVAIIALLMSLTAAAVMKFIGKGPQVQNASEIQQLATAIESFTTNFKLGSKGYFPSKLKLCEKLGDYNLAVALDQDSLSFLKRMFPRLDTTPVTSFWAKTGIDWNGNGRRNDPPVILEGDQCLVFFLGGIPIPDPSTPGVQGFSTNQADPSQSGGTRKGPYFEFNTGRLVQRSSATGNLFYSYLDAYGKQPFLYFSSYSRRNGYNPYDATNQRAKTPMTSVSDCAGLGVWPYAEALTPSIRYLKPDSFQIISAGEDKMFGPGTVLNPLPAGGPFLWKPSTATSIPTAGRDDQTNFTGSLLGVNDQ
jgi:general secretion pathway protein G